MHSIYRVVDSYLTIPKSTYHHLGGFKNTLTYAPYHSSRSTMSCPNTLPASWYTSKAIADLERRAIFDKVWS